MTRYYVIMCKYGYKQMPIETIADWMIPVLINELLENVHINVLTLDSSEKKRERKLNSMNAVICTRSNLMADSQGPKRVDG